MVFYGKVLRNLVDHCLAVVEDCRKLESSKTFNYITSDLLFR